LTRHRLYYHFAGFETFRDWQRSVNEGLHPALEMQIHPLDSQADRLLACHRIDAVVGDARYDNALLRFGSAIERQFALFASVEQLLLLHSDYQYGAAPDGLDVINGCVKQEALAHRRAAQIADLLCRRRRIADLAASPPRRVRLRTCQRVGRVARARLSEISGLAD